VTDEKKDPMTNPNPDVLTPAEVDAGIQEHGASWYTKERRDAAERWRDQNIKYGWREHKRK